MDFVFSSEIGEEIKENEMYFQVYQLKIKSKEHRPMNGDSSDEHLASEYVQDTANMDKKRPIKRIGDLIFSRFRNKGGKGKVNEVGGAIHPDGPIKFKWWIRQRNVKTGEERVFTLEARKPKSTQELDLKFGVDASGRVWFLEDTQSLWLYKFQEDGQFFSLYATAVVETEDTLRTLAEVEIPIQFKSVDLVQVGDAVYAVKNLKVTEEYPEKK